MRILLLNTSFPPQARSAARLFYELGRSLLSSGHEVSVVTEFPWRRLSSESRASALPEREKMDGMDVTRVGGYSFREGSMIGRGINHLLIPLTFFRAARLAGVHDVALVYSPPLTLGLTAWMLKRRLETPFVFNVQDIYPQTPIDLGYMKNVVLIRFFEWLERFIYRQADRVVVHSDGNKDYLASRNRVEPGKLLAIPNWVDTEELRPGNRWNGFRQKHGIGDQFLVCYAGTMGYAQDLCPIIEAATKLRDHKDILFLLVGEGVWADEWRKKAAPLRNVRFLPLLPRSEYQLLLGACDAGLVPLAEKLKTPVVPGKLLDFMAAGRPVIATANPDGDTAKIVRAAKCGFALSPGDSNGVADAALFLHNHASVAEKFARNGRQYAETHFSLKACSQKYLQVFREILSATSGEAPQPTLSPVTTHQLPAAIRIPRRH
jgi:colanic acid biosynthesis glycosyl transferase WcaI